MYLVVLIYKSILDCWVCVFSRENWQCPKVIKRMASELVNKQRKGQKCDPSQQVCWRGLLSRAMRTAVAEQFLGLQVICVK